MEEDKEHGVQFESGPVQLCMFNKRRVTRRNKEGEFSLKVFNRRGGREGKGICREMRAELGKGGYCKVPVEFKFLQYCCGIIHDTCDTYNTSRYCTSSTLFSEKGQLSGSGAQAAIGRSQQKKFG